MKIKKQAGIVSRIMALFIVCLAFNTAAKDMPASGKPGAAKPVKIFLLSGQSNMTGRGYLGNLDAPATDQKARLVRCPACGIYRKVC